MSPSGRSLWSQRPLREAAGRSLLDGEGRARWEPPQPPLQPQCPPSWGWNQGTAPRGFCGQWAPGVPQRCPGPTAACPAAHRLPQKLLSDPRLPRATAPQPVPGTPSRPGRVWPTASTPSSPARSPPLGWPLDHSARPSLPPAGGAAETSRAEGPPSPLGDHTAGRENGHVKKGRESAGVGTSCDGCVCDCVYAVCTPVCAAAWSAAACTPRVHLSVCLPHGWLTGCFRALSPSTRHKLGATGRGGRCYCSLETRRQRLRRLSVQALMVGTGRGRDCVTLKDTFSSRSSACRRGSEILACIPTLLTGWNITPEA